MRFTELEQVIKKYLVLEDPHILRLVCGFIIAARLPIKAPWLFIVAGSSGGKSTILQALERITGIIMRDDITANSLVSGMRSFKGESNSLIEQMMPNTILVVKDLSLLMSKDEKIRGEALAVLRQIYDGKFQKSYGNGVVIDWQGKMSLLAGTTTKIYTVLYQFSALGERYLLYRFLQPDRKSTTRKSLEKESMIDGKAEEEMLKSFKEFIENISIPDKLPEIEDQIKNDIIDLSELVTRARSNVERDMRDPKKPTTQVHDLEMPMRFAKQIMAIVYGLAVMNGNETLLEDDKKLIYKLCLDCIPLMRKICLQNLTHYKTISTRGLSIALQLPTVTVRMALEDLTSLGIAKRTSIKNNQDNWQLKDEYKKLLAKYEEITITEDILEEEQISDVDLVAAAQEVFANKEDI